MYKRIYIVILILVPYIYTGKLTVTDKSTSAQGLFDAVDDGVGTHLLEISENKRLELQLEVRHMLTTTSTIQQKLKLAKLSEANRSLLTSSSTYALQEESYNIYNMVHYQGMSYLLEADLCTQEGHYERARDLYEMQIIVLTSSSTSALSSMGPSMRPTSKGSRRHSTASNNANTNATSHRMSTLTSASSFTTPQPPLPTRAQSQSQSQPQQPTVNLKLLALCYGRLGRMLMLQVCSLIYRLYIVHSI